MYLLFDNCVRNVTLVDISKHLKIFRVRGLYVKTFIYFLIYQFTKQLHAKFKQLYYYTPFIKF